MNHIKGGGSNDFHSSDVLPTAEPRGRPAAETGPDHRCFSTAQFTYHEENEHSLQLQSYNLSTEQM